MERCLCKVYIRVRDSGFIFRDHCLHCRSLLIISAGEAIILARCFLEDRTWPVAQRFFSLLRSPVGEVPYSFNEFR